MPGAEVDSRSAACACGPRSRTHALPVGVFPGDDRTWVTHALSVAMTLASQPSDSITGSCPQDEDVLWRTGSVGGSNVPRKPFSVCPDECTPT